MRIAVFVLTHSAIARGPTLGDLQRHRSCFNVSRRNRNSRNQAAKSTQLNRLEGILRGVARAWRGRNDHPVAYTAADGSEADAGIWETPESPTTAARHTLHVDRVHSTCEPSVTQSTAKWSSQQGRQRPLGVIARI